MDEYDSKTNSYGKDLSQPGGYQVAMERDASLEAMAQRLDEIVVELVELRTRLTRIETQRAIDAKRDPLPSGLMSRIEEQIHPVIAAAVEGHWTLLERSMGEIITRVERVGQEMAARQVNAAKESLRTELKAYLETVAMRRLGKETQPLSAPVRAKASNREERLKALSAILPDNPLAQPANKPILEQIINSFSSCEDEGWIAQRVASLLQPVQEMAAVRMLEWLALSPSAPARACGLSALAGKGALTAEILMAASRDPDAGVRAAALKAAFLQGGNLNEDVFSRALSDPVPDVRAVAVEYLGWCGTDSSRRAAADMLSDETPKVRMAAVEAVVASGVCLRDLLQPLCEDRDENIRMKVVAVLADKFPDAAKQAQAILPPPDNA